MCGERVTELVIIPLTIIWVLAGERKEQRLLGPVKKCQHVHLAGVVSSGMPALGSYMSLQGRYKTMRPRETSRGEVFFYRKVGELRDLGFAIMDDGDQAETRRKYGFLTSLPSLASFLKSVPTRRLKIK